MQITTSDLTEIKKDCKKILWIDLYNMLVNLDEIRQIRAQKKYKLSKEGNLFFLTMWLQDLSSWSGMDPMPPLLHWDAQSVTAGPPKEGPRVENLNRLIAREERLDQLIKISQKEKSGSYDFSGRVLSNLQRRRINMIPSQTLPKHWQS